MGILMGSNFLRYSPLQKYQIAIIEKRLDLGTYKGWAEKGR